MEIIITRNDIDLNNIYFGFEIGQNYDYINKDFYTYGDIILLEKTSFTFKKDKDIINIYINPLTNKTYYLNSENKVVNNDPNTINSYIENMISVSDLFEEYKDINNHVYNDLIDRFKDQVVPRRLFFDNLSEITDLKNYIDEYKENQKIKVRKILET